MYHVCAYRTVTGAAITNSALQALSDGYATVSGTSFIFQKDFTVQWAAAFGATITNARVNTPYLRALGIPSIQPVDVAVTPTSLPGIADMRNSGFKIRAIDPTDFEASDTAIDNVTGVLGLRDTVQNLIPAGPVTIIRATAALTGGNGVWFTGAMAFDQTLQAGRYAVVGMDVVGANLIAARLVFADTTLRPGVIARTALANKPDPMFLEGAFGNWGEFENTAPPLLDVLGNAAPVTQTIFMKVVKVR